MAGRRRREPGTEEREAGSDFAALLGDVTPMQEGPERVLPPRPPARPTRKGTTAAARPGGFRWPDPSDRHRAAAPGVADALLLDLARGEPAPEERIDLHGVRADRAEALIVARLESARARGLACVALIHGRGARSPDGDATLRNAMPGWLTGRAAPHVLAFAPAPERLGGAGATLVRLRSR